jgi:hypothetical protein
MDLTEEMLSVLDQSSGIIGLIESIEIYQPNWNDTLRYVNNSRLDLTLTDENGVSKVYKYANIEISRAVDSDTLEQSFSFAFGDLGSIVPELVDLFINDSDIVLPTFAYRAYLIGRYDSPYIVFKNLEIETIIRDWQGARADAKAPSLNESGNGRVYNPTTDPSLSGFY